MADLESAADLALTKVKELKEHVDDAQDAIAAFQEEIERLSSQLEADAEALAEKARSLLESAEEARSTLTQESQEAADAQAELNSSVGQARAEGEADIREAQGQVASFAQQVEGVGPQVASLVEQAVEAFRGLAAQAAQVEGQIEQALDDAREFVGVQMVEDLRAIQEQVRERAEAVRNTLAEECASAIDDKYTEWEGRLAEIEAFVAKAFTDAQQHAEEVVAYSLEECAKGHTEALDELRDLVADAVEPAIEKLKAAVAERGTDLEASTATVDQGMEETGSGLQAAIAALDAVKQLLASYTFVQV